MLNTETLFLSKACRGNNQQCLFTVPTNVFFVEPEQSPALNTTYPNITITGEVGATKKYKQKRTNCHIQYHFN